MSLNTPNVQDVAWQVAAAIEDMNVQTPIITGLKQMPSVSRGISYSPNVYRDPTLYKVLGEHLKGEKSEYSLIYHWLSEHDKNKLPTTKPKQLGYGAQEEWYIELRQGEWFVVRYYSYLGG